MMTEYGECIQGSEMKTYFIEKYMENEDIVHIGRFSEKVNGVLKLIIMIWLSLTGIVGAEEYSGSRFFRKQTM